MKYGYRPYEKIYPYYDESSVELCSDCYNIITRPRCRR